MGANNSALQLLEQHLFSCRSTVAPVDVAHTYGWCHTWIVKEAVIVCYPEAFNGK